MDVLIEIYADPVLIKDERVLQSMFDLQSGYQPKMENQTEIKHFMRQMVAEWMLEVCEEQQRDEDVFPLSMNYFDRVLSMTRISKSSLQLLGAACIFTASKLIEGHPISAETLVFYTDHSITNTMLMDMAWLVICKLKWDSSDVLVQDFRGQVLNATDSSVGNSLEIHSVRAIGIVDSTYFGRNSGPAPTDLAFKTNPEALVKVRKRFFDEAVRTQDAGSGNGYTGDTSKDMSERLFKESNPSLNCDADCIGETELSYEECCQSVSKSYWDWNMLSIGGLHRWLFVLAVLCLSNGTFACYPKTHGDKDVNGDHANTGLCPKQLYRHSSRSELNWCSSDLRSQHIAVDISLMLKACRPVYLCEEDHSSSSHILQMCESVAYDVFMKNVAVAIVVVSLCFLYGSCGQTIKSYFQTVTQTQSTVDAGKSISAAIWKDEQLSNAHIAFLATHIGNGVTFIGFQIGFSKAQIEQIRSDNIHKTADQFVDLFSKWKQINPCATLQTLGMDLGNLRCHSAVSIDWDDLDREFQELVGGEYENSEWRSK